MLRQIQVTGEQRMAEVSNRTIAQLVERLKDWRIPIHGTRGYPKAEVTAGGVVLGEVNFQSMESKKTPGLFLAGEILDLDARSAVSTSKPLGAPVTPLACISKVVGTRVVGTFHVPQLFSSFLERVETNERRSQMKICGRHWRTAHGMCLLQCACYYERDCRMSWKIAS